jgi:holliday junction DNA helicase RuvA
MIAWLNGTLIDRKDQAVILDVNGVGYEVFCARNTIDALGTVGSPCRLHIHTQYRSESIALFGFVSTGEKNLFLSLIKVDSVGPKSALNIMSGAPWTDLVGFIEEGDVAQLAKLPKVSKKTAEHLVVKLRGKLADLFFVEDKETGGKLSERREKTSGARKLKLEAQTALTHLGYKPAEIDRALNDLKEEMWTGELQAVLRHALQSLSGNR